MEQFFKFLGDYLNTILFNWYGIILVITGLVDLVERTFDKKTTIPAWVRTVALISVFLLAQMFAYKDLKENYDKATIENATLKGEKTGLQGKLSAEQSKNENLEKQVKEQPKVIYRDQASKVSAPPTINSLFVEARAVCSFRDPINIPGSIARMGAIDLNSFFDGPSGKAYLHALDQATFQRTEEEGKASTVLRYDLPSNSSLTGQPISSLSNYNYMRISLWALNYERVTRCPFVELTLRLNGKDIFRKQITSLPPLSVPNANQYIDVPTKEIKLSQ